MTIQTIVPNIPNLCGAPEGYTVEYDNLCAFHANDSPADKVLRRDIYRAIADLLYDVPTDVHAVCPVDIYINLLENNKKYIFVDCATDQEMHNKMRAHCSTVVAQLMYCKVLDVELKHGYVSDFTFFSHLNNAMWELFRFRASIRINYPYLIHPIRPEDVAREIKLPKSEQQTERDERHEKWRTQQALKRVKNFPMDERDLASTQQKNQGTSERNVVEQPAKRRGRPPKGMKPEPESYC